MSNDKDKELGFGLHKDGSGRAVVMTELDDRAVVVALKPGTGTEWAFSGEKAAPHTNEKGANTVEILEQGLVRPGLVRSADLMSSTVESGESARAKAVQIAEEAFNKATGINKAVVAEPQKLTGKIVGFVEKEDDHAVLTIKRAGTLVSIPVDSSLREQARSNLGEGVRYEPQTKGEPAKIVNLQQEKGKSQEKGLGA